MVVVVNGALEVSTEQQLSTSISPSLGAQRSRQPMLVQVKASTPPSPWGYTANSVWQAARVTMTSRRGRHRGKVKVSGSHPTGPRAAQDPTDVVVWPVVSDAGHRLRARIALSLF